MNKEELEVEEFPRPLKLAFIQYDEEPEPFKKLHRLLDAVEVLVKLHTVVVVSDYFRKSDASEKTKGLLAGGLRRPSLGIWWQFARELCKEMQDAESTFFLSGLERYVGARTKGREKWKGDLFQALEESENLISFRNKYAHGATPPDEESTADFEKYEKVFRGLVLRAVHFKEARLVAVEEDGVGLFPPLEERFESSSEKIPRGEENAGKCFLLREDGECLPLHPLLFCRRGNPNSNYGFFFYNDLRDKDANLLEYDRCWRWRDESMREALLGTFPIDRWKGFTDSEIQATIDRLTESFKGRVEEIDGILRFVARPRGGPLMIWGGPGIGKSALLARTIQALAWSPQERANENLGGAEGVERFVVVRYFIRRSGQTNDADKMLDHLNEELEKFSKSKIASGTNLKEKTGNFQERLRRASKKLGDEERLVVFVDGLDEGTDEMSLLESLPLEMPEKISLVYSSREIPEVRNRIWSKLDRERRSEFTVHRLGKGEVRALLYDFVNKYAMTEAYLEQVIVKSQGNPLYLKLLCQGLEQGAYRLNDLNALPKEVEDLYRDMLARYAAGHPLALGYLCLLATAKDFLPHEVAADMMEVSQQEIEQVVGVCRECLYDSPETEDVEDYQLFHESMREYLLERKRGECEKWKRRLADWCEDWNKQEKSEFARDYGVIYRVEHQWDWAEHLRENRRSDEAQKREQAIIRAMEDEDFRSELFLRCGHPETLRRNLQRAQKLLLKGGEEANRKRVLSLARTYHEEPFELLNQLLDDLEQAGEKGNFEEVFRRAESGGDSRQKAMLTLRGLWRGEGGPATGSKLNEKMQEWLERADDPELRELAAMKVPGWAND